MSWSNGLGGDAVYETDSVLALPGVWMEDGAKDIMLPRRNFYWGEGEQERMMARRRFVFEKARDSFDIDETTALWNEHCEAEGLPLEKRERSTIAKDRLDGLKALAEETRIDAEVFRQLLIARIEQAFSTERFRSMIENANLGAIDRLLKGIAEIAKLSGAYAPTLNALTDSKGNDILPSLTDAERQVRIAGLFQLAKERAMELGVVIDAELVPDPEPQLSMLAAIGGTVWNQNAEEAESSAS